ncbi:MAG: hypothetical protein KC657_02630 [Myxococcales bacterium]|nr:hypothetical protein [Myxococcales bacterium]
MAMNFIKGLIGGQDQYAQPGQVMNPYALPPGAQQGQPGAPAQQSTFVSPEQFAAQQAAAYGQPPVGGAPPPQPAPTQPSTYGVSGQPAAGQGIAGQGIAGQGVAGQGVAGQAPTMADLQRDLDAMALFARTLLTLLEEKKVLTRAEFQEVHNRLDMLDGKLDGRVGDGK